ncbi:hypothetical protein [Cellulomonas hominis]
MGQGLHGSRRTAGVVLACLGCAGLALSVGRAFAQDDLLGPPLAGCAVHDLAVGYDVGYDATLGGFAVTQAHVDGVPKSCAGRQIALTLIGADHAQLTEIRAPGTSPTTSFALEDAHIAAEAVDSVALAIVTEPRPAAGPDGPDGPAAGS